MPSDEPIHQLNNLNMLPNIDLNILEYFCHVLLLTALISMVTLVRFGTSGCVTWKTLLLMNSNVSRGHAEQH